MNFIAEFVLWPVDVFLRAVCGVLHRARTPIMASWQRIARLALLASLTVFGTVPVLLIPRPTIGIKPPLALGVGLLLVFIVIGKLCDDQAHDKGIQAWEEPD
jgi:hypothetical protein